MVLWPFFGNFLEEVTVFDLKDFLVNVLKLGKEQGELSKGAGEQ